MYGRSTAEVDYERASDQEPESMPRSTGSSLLVSTAVESEPSTVSHDMLVNQVLFVTAFSGEDKYCITFTHWHKHLELVRHLWVVKPCEAAEHSN